MDLHNSLHGAGATCWRTRLNFMSRPYLAYFLLKHDSIYVYVEPIEVSLVLLIEVIYGNVDKCLMCNIG